MGLKFDKIIETAGSIFVKFDKDNVETAGGILGFILAWPITLLGYLFYGIMVESQTDRVKHLFKFMFSDFLGFVIGLIVIPMEGMAKLVVSIIYLPFKILGML